MKYNQSKFQEVLKKIQDNATEFELILEKISGTENAAVKKKIGGDLSCVMKKQLKLRSQLKIWSKSGEVIDDEVSVTLVELCKLVETEMERYTVHVKERKIKSFSTEGLSRELKMDPQEKAKAEARDWLNNVVSQLEYQIGSFESEMEGISGRKGKTRPPTPRVTHLDASVVRHMVHIKKLELILRLLNNDELCPEHVNDVKEVLEHYVLRNQADFDSFGDVDELYTALLVEKMEQFKDLTFTHLARVPQN